MKSRIILAISTALLFVASSLSLAATIDYSLASKIEQSGSNAVQITDMRATKTDRLTRVQVEVTNITSADAQIYYRFQWFDKDGFVVWDDEPWKPMIVYGNQKQIINTAPPILTATDFRLKMHTSNRVY